MSDEENANDSSACDLSSLLEMLTGVVPVVIRGELKTVKMMGKFGGNFVFVLFVVNCEESLITATF